MQSSTAQVPIVVRFKRPQHNTTKFLALGVGNLEFDRSHVVVRDPLVTVDSVGHLLNVIPVLGVSASLESLANLEV